MTHCRRCNMTDYLKKIKQLHEVLNYKVKFLRKYMKMFEVLLLFMRASREEN